MKEEKSKCCGKEKVANYSDEGTGCYLCQGCLGEFIPTDEVKESVNFMQVGNGHCFICHKETAPNDIHKQCFNKPITYCSNTCDKKWSKHNPLNKSVTEDTEWEKEFYKRFNADYAESGRDETMEDAIDFIKNLLSKARQEGQQEERQFILNILDGIDEADRQMQNEGGGTKAIRMALNVRIIN